MGAEHAWLDYFRLGLSHASSGRATESCTLARERCVIYLLMRPRHKKWDTRSFRDHDETTTTVAIAGFGRIQEGNIKFISYLDDLPTDRDEVA